MHKGGLKPDSFHFNQGNKKHLHNICTMRRRRWAGVVQMLYKCFVFAWNSSCSGGDYKPTPTQYLLNAGPASPVLASRHSVLMSTSFGIICNRLRLFAIACDGLQPFAIISDHFRSFATVRDRSRSFATICDSLRPFATICDRLRPFAIVCDRLRSFATICDRLRPFATICDCLRWFATICDRVRPLAIVCDHLQLCTSTNHSLFLLSLLHCHIIHLTILRRFSWLSLAYMCTNLA